MGHLKAAMERRKGEQITGRKGTKENTPKINFWSGHCKQSRCHKVMNGVDSTDVIKLYSLVLISFLIALFILSLRQKLDVCTVLVR